MIVFSAILYVAMHVFIVLVPNSKFSHIIRRLMLLPAVGSVFYTQIYKIFHWYYFIASFPISYICYIVSCFIIDSEVTKKSFFLQVPIRISGTLKKAYHKKLLHNFYSSTVEELTYRGLLFHCVFQLTNSKLIAGIIITILFAVAHYFSPMAMIQRIDIFVFSLIITLLYALCMDIYMVIVIHIMRNMFVIMQHFYIENQKQQRLNLFYRKMKEARK